MVTRAETTCARAVEEMANGTRGGVRGGGGGIAQVGRVIPPLYRTFLLKEEAKLEGFL